MVEQLTLPGVVDPEAGRTGSGGRAFTQWLRLQLRARKLTQRQLAQRSGVDHSTISRLMRGDRTPSLRTVTLLARGLGLSQDPGWLDAQSFGTSDSPAARVEYALRSDGLLTDPDTDFHHQMGNVHRAGDDGHVRAVFVVRHVGIEAGRADRDAGPGVRSGSHHKYLIARQMGSESRSNPRPPSRHRAPSPCLR